MLGSTSTLPSMLTVAFARPASVALLNMLASVLVQRLQIAAYVRSWSTRGAVVIAVYAIRWPAHALRLATKRGSRPH